MCPEGFIKSDSKTYLKSWTLRSVANDHMTSDSWLASQNVGFQNLHLSHKKTKIRFKMTRNGPNSAQHVDQNAIGQERHTVPWSLYRMLQQNTSKVELIQKAKKDGWWPFGLYDGGIPLQHAKIKSSSVLSMDKLCVFLTVRMEGKASTRIEDVPPSLLQRRHMRLLSPTCEIRRVWEKWKKERSQSKIPRNLLNTQPRFNEVLMCFRQLKAVRPESCWNWRLNISQKKREN